MDWLKLFAFLVAVASLPISAEGPKKKIRIHLPEKVKHIHHHKKIYITNHAASSQYAPQYAPSAEAAAPVPSSVALPSVGGLVPLNSVEVYDEPYQSLRGLAPASSKLLPLYSARGYYGPKPSDYDDQDIDLVPPPEPTENSYQSAAYAPLAATASTSNHVHKRVKIASAPRKKPIHKKPPKRVVVRGRPQPQEDEHPVSNFHEHFYSDLEGSGTIRRIKKPPRIEKIIDGNTEHIHTYSEEHIHKIVYDEPNQGIDHHVGSMSALAGAQPLVPIKHGPTFVAIQQEPLAGLAAIGAPTHFEYAAYNPRDVTHDHIFHDHGEVAADIDITKNSLGYPKATYNSQGLRLSGRPTTNKRPKNPKYPHKYPKAAKPAVSNDYAYYNGLYAAAPQQPYRPKKVKATPAPLPAFDLTNPAGYDDYRPIPAFRFKDTNSKISPKIRNYSSQPVPAPYYSHTQVQDYRSQPGSVPAPFQVSSTVLHEYEPKGTSGYTSGISAPTAFSKFKDPLVNFKDTYANNFEYDAYASSSNVYATEDKSENVYEGKKGKKSVSSQNINFNGQDTQSTIDHLDENDNDESVPSAIDNFDNFEQVKSTDAGVVAVAATPTAYTIKDTSPAHQYYTAMAIKALNTEQLGEASNNNYQFVEPPTPSTTPYSTSVATTAPTQYDDTPNVKSDHLDTEPTEQVAESRPVKRQRDKPKHPEVVRVEPRPRYSAKAFKSSEKPTPTLRHSENKFQMNLKYGDKI